MAGEMTKKDIEPGGLFHDLRLKLEEVAEDLCADSVDVQPFDVYQGPVCYISFRGTKASLWWDDSTGMLVLRTEGTADRKQVVFYQDEATEEIWERLKHSIF